MTMSASAQFTPGPWAIDSDGDVVAESCEVAAVWWCGDEGRANAHLIAAAPELFEAVEAAIEFIESVDPDSFTLRWCREAAAKARGEQVSL